jgi:hypothetical protein
MHVPNHCHNTRFRSLQLSQSPSDGCQRFWPFCWQSVVFCGPGTRWHDEGLPSADIRYIGYAGLSANAGYRPFFIAERRSIARRASDGSATNQEAELCSCYANDPDRQTPTSFQLLTQCSSQLFLWLLYLTAQIRFIYWLWPPLM